MRKPLYFILLALSGLLFACESGTQKNTGTEDSISPATLATPVIPVAPPDLYVTELKAQDTLFEDGSKPSGWDVAGFDDPADFKKFMIEFKDWVNRDVADSIIAHIQFPLKKYATPALFKAKYAEIFDKKTKQVVANMRLDRIFRNYQGAMIGDGLIWFNQTPSGYRIIAINK
ncbi:hypothetical protein [Chitinophaga defluvii]|uniref:Uncharacterized protein n=1 Tax=Chitinophaga defluvii TaxID=3163343 RepID=A0ABV2T4N0_9BACT